MSLTGPPPVTATPLRLMADDLLAELRAPARYPPGDVLPSVRRTHRMVTDPLGLLLDAYERHGPVFSLRILSTRVVWMLGPAANHHILVSHAGDFTWRDGFFRDLIPLLGDGLLTIDGEFHRRSRRIMLPAFHRERIAAALGAMEDEIDRALRAVAAGPAGRPLRLDARAGAAGGHARAVRPGSGPPAARPRPGARVPGTRSRFYGREYWLQVLRGPGTPWAALRRARQRLDGLIYAEIARRRRTGERGEDLLSLLLDAEDEDGGRLGDRHVRDEVMTHALRRPRHDHRDRRLPLLRARPPPRRRRRGWRAELGRRAGR